MSFRNLITTLLFLAFVSSCKDTNSTESAETSENGVDSLAQDKANTNNEPNQVTIYVWVENLRMRTEPDTKSDIVAELKEGAAITYLNEKSNFTQKITLRGKQYDEPWLNVKTSDNKTGWVYGGGVKFYQPKVGAIPTPYDGCMDLRKRRREQAFQDCVDRIMEKQLRKDSRLVQSKDKGLRFTLLGGDKKELIANATKDIEVDWSEYAYRYYIPKMGYFVVEAIGHEKGMHLLVNDKSGKETPLSGFPKASPDYKHLVTTNADLGAQFEYNGVQILGFTDAGLSVVWEKEIESQEPIQSKWLDQNTVEISFRPPPSKSSIKTKILELKQDIDGEWKFSEEIK